jgi:hypothetical protein
MLGYPSWRGLFALGDWASFTTVISADHRATLGTDEAMSAASVAGCRAHHITSHVAQNITPQLGRAIDGRTTRHPTCPLSQRCSKRVEEVFGWLKTIGVMRKLRHRGGAMVNWLVILRTTASNMMRMRNLREVAA